MRRNTTGLCHALSLAASLGGCSADAADKASSSTTIDTVAGVERIRNIGAGPNWSVREVLTLGSSALETGATDEFGRIAAAISDSDGNIYVADAQAREIRVFDASGGLVRRIGRSGSGPGEFMTLQSIGWLGDTLVVLDAGNARVGLMSRTGEWIDQRPHARLTGTGLHLHQTGPAELYTPGFRRTQTSIENVFARHDALGTKDTIAAPRDPARAPAAVACMHNAGGGISFWAVDFSPRLIRLPAPNGERLDLFTGEYKLVFVRPTGDTARVIERDFAPLTLTDAEWAAEEAEFKAWKDKLPPSSCQPASLQRPATTHLIRGVFFDQQQRIWVERRRTAGFTFDVFTRDGRLIGMVDVPARVEQVPVYIRGNRLLLVTADSMDAQQVKVLEVSETRRGQR